MAIDTLVAPSSLLPGLVEKREAANKAFQEYTDPLAAEKRDLTPEEQQKSDELYETVKVFDARIDKEHDLEKRNAGFAERRAQINAGVDPTRISNVKEPLTYEEGSPNSWVADFVRSQSPAWPGHYDAVARLLRASHEVDVELASTNDRKEVLKIEGLFRETYRDGGGGTAKRMISEARERGRAGRPAMEARAGMDTTASSGGSFATPIYFVNKYAPWREAGRAFADECNKQPLPEYGMTVYLPHVTGPAQIASQVGQNYGIAETDPSAGYLSSNLTTLAGQVTVSQQLLDRAGPNFSFDTLVFDQLHRDYDPKVDQFVIAQAIANATSVSYTGSFAMTGTSGVGGFYGIVGQAKSNIRTTSGVFLNPTHLFVWPERWEYMSAWADANGRPILVPGYAGPYNAAAAGNSNGDTGVEGDTGYRFNGLPAFQDFNIPLDSSNRDQAIVGALNEVWYWEGAPIPRVMPQTVAQNLSVLLQMYTYIGAIVPYAAAIQLINGAGMSAMTF